MTATLSGDYAGIVKNNKFLYVPSCVIVEMMDRLYHQVALVDLSGNLHTVVPDLLVLIRRLNRNLHCTAEAYREERIKNFIGDWKNDKVRARKLFFNLMSRLGYLSELVGKVERRLLYQDIEVMGREWAELDKIMEKNCSSGGLGKNCTLCGQFQSVEAEHWRHIMVNLLLYLNATASYPDDKTYLILLCYKQLRNKVLNQLAQMRELKDATRDVLATRILCITDEDQQPFCSACAHLTANTRVHERLPSLKDTVPLLRPSSATSVKPAQSRSTTSLKKVMVTQVSELNRGLAPAAISGINHHFNLPSS